MNSWIIKVCFLCLFSAGSSVWDRDVPPGDISPPKVFVPFRVKPNSWTCFLFAQTHKWRCGWINTAGRRTRTDRSSSTTRRRASSPRTSWRRSTLRVSVGIWGDAPASVSFLHLLFCFPQVFPASWPHLSDTNPHTTPLLSLHSEIILNKLQCNKMFLFVLRFLVPPAGVWWSLSEVQFLQLQGWKNTFGLLSWTQSDGDLEV